MKKAGGIIALIGSIFGVLSALAALAIAGPEGVHTVEVSRLAVISEFNGTYPGFAMNEPGIVFDLHLGWVVVCFAMATFMLSVICLNVAKHLPALLLIICAAIAAFLGGGHIALYMSMALVGGILALFPKPKQPQYA
ncbi:MAG: hypothetical protein OXG24_01820 [Gammaproteobacteria bacterium]|nr:hypothetical protein [Gammaproteobacteria bacterium]